MTRELVCTRCKQPVTVAELPRPFIDPARYVCGQCQESRPGQTALTIDQPAAETRSYDPAVAEIPY